MICGFLQGYRMGNQVQEVRIPAQESIPIQPPKPPFDQLKTFLSPEQQSRLEEIAMLMQAVSQFT